MGVGGKRESKKESKRKKKETHPAQWDGLEGIEKRVGSWGKKKRKKESKRKKAQGEHQRIYIRRSIRRKLQKGENYKLAQVKRVFEELEAKDRFPDHCQ